jgi:hypothetical protein
MVQALRILFIPPHLILHFPCKTAIFGTGPKSLVFSLFWQG